MALADSPLCYISSVRTALLLLLALLFTPALGTAQSPAHPAFSVSPETRDAVRQLIGDSILNGKAYDYDAHLADMIGARLTGSSNYLRAVDWARQQFTALELVNVHTEEWTIPATWEPENAAVGRIVSPVDHDLHIYSAGWSPSTPEQGISSDVVYISSLATDALDAQKARITGKVALVDSSSYRGTPSIGGVFQGFDHLRSLTPAAILTTGGANGTQALGVIGLRGTIAPVPQAQLGLEDSLLIKRLLREGPVSLSFSFANKIRKEVKIPNVFAEIRGSELPDEVVIVGAHLDSWQPGTGAQDNGTGAASVLEAARAIQALHRPPRRTIRFALFGGEEQASLGSTAYVRQHIANLPKIDAVVITDTGAAPAKGWYLMSREDERGAIEAFGSLLQGLGADGITSGTDYMFQSDHAAFNVLGVPCLVLWNDTDKYDTLAHRASDTFDAVVQKDLTQGAAVVTVTAYAVADGKEPFAAHLSPAEMQSALQKAGTLSDYNYLKSIGTLP
jgi:carboxypeptidase Q